MVNIVLSLAFVKVVMLMVELSVLSTILMIIFYLLFGYISLLDFLSLFTILMTYL